MQQTMLDVGYKPNSIIVKMAGLHGFARFLHSQCGIHCDGVIVSRLLVSGRSKMHGSPAQDSDNLLEAACTDNLDNSWQDFRTHALTMLMSTDGLKVGEALGLDFRDVNLTRRKALIRRGPKSRIARLSLSTTRAITEYLTVCPFNIGDGWPLFVGKSGERLGDRATQLTIASLRNELGLHELTTSKSLRSGRILELRAKGYNDIAIMQELGLSSRRSLQLVLANAPRDYAAMELAASQVRDKFAPVHDGRSVEQLDTPVAPQRPEHETQPSRRGRRRIIVHDANAASYIDHLFSAKPHNTAVSYSSVIRRFADEFLPSVQRCLPSASADDIRAFIQTQKTRSSSTATLYRAALKDFYIFLLDSGAVGSIPVLDVEPYPPRERDHFRDAASIVDVRAWVSKLWNYTELHPEDLKIIRLQAFVFMLALEGLKSHEALALRKSALMGGLLQVEGRTLLLAHHTNTALEMLNRFSSPTADFIFSSTHTGRPTDHRTMLNWMKKIEHRLELPKVTPEQLTQAFRRNLFATLGDAVEASNALGLRSSDQFAAGQKPHVAKNLKPSSTR
jgi:integrase/recombinase XerC